MMVCNFSCWSGVRDLIKHDKQALEFQMFLQSGESSRLIDYMLYQSLEETGRIRSIIFRRLGKLIIDKTTIGDYVFKGV